MKDCSRRICLISMQPPLSDQRLGTHFNICSQYVYLHTSVYYVFCLCFYVPIYAGVWCVCLFTLILCVFVCLCAYPCVYVWVLYCISILARTLLSLTAVCRTCRCDYSADGLHVKMFVDNMRAKMLFNHICDHEFNWKGDMSHFE